MTSRLFIMLEQSRQLVWGPNRQLKQEKRRVSKKKFDKGAKAIASSTNGTGAIEEHMQKKKGKEREGEREEVKKERKDAQCR